MTIKVIKLTSFNMIHRPNLKKAMKSAVPCALFLVVSTIAADAVTRLSQYRTIVDDGAYNSTPGSVALANGDYLLAYRKGSCHVCKSSVVVRRSRDHGRTWGSEEDIYNPLAGNDPIFLLSPHGTLRIFFDFAAPVTGEAGFGYKTSNDNGASWSNATTFMTDPPSEVVAGGNFVRVGRSTYFAGYGRTAGGFGAHLFASRDDGRTWRKVSTITRPHVYPGNEITIAYLGRANFVAVMRDAASTKTFAIKSRDMGRTWSSLIDVTSQVGVLQAPLLTWVGCTLLLTGRQFRSLGPSTFVAYFSLDNGKTFAHRRVIETYKGDAIDGGYSSAIAVNKHLAYVVYYADQAGDRRPAIRSVLLQITSHSVAVRGTPRLRRHR